MYYGLFHNLASAGAAVFAAGGPALEAQATRAFAHNTMLNVCKAFAQSTTRPFQPPLDGLMQNKPDGRLVFVADSFVKLQEARHTADYNMAAHFTRQDGLDLLRLAQEAHKQFGEVQTLPETIVFLTALLLADRWSRRG